MSFRVIFFYFFYLLIPSAILQGSTNNLSIQLEEFFKEFSKFDNPDEWSSLSYALEKGNFEVFYYLFKRERPKIWKYKSLLQEADVYETTPLHTAIRLKNLELLSFLLKNLKINKIDDLYETQWYVNREVGTLSPLGLALYEEYCDPDVIDLLCSHLTSLQGWKTHLRYGSPFMGNKNSSYFEMSPIQQALAINRCDIAVVLASHGYQIDHKTLHESIRLGWQEGVDMHLANHIEICAECLVIALKYEHYELYKNLFIMFTN